MSAIKKIITKETVSKEIHKEMLIGLIKCQSLEFTLSLDGKEISYEPTLEAFEYRFDVISSINVKEKRFDVLLTITILLKSTAKTRRELATHKSLVSFRVENLEALIVKKGNEVILPRQLYLLAYGAAISTSRGMLVLHTEKTRLRNSILPLFNPQLLVDNIKAGI